MPWGKVDDKLHSHPKPERAGLAAMGLWTLALSYCSDLLTDGYVSRERTTRLAGSAGVATKLAAALVAARLWHPADAPCNDPKCNARRQPDGTDGWRFHEWDTYQPTRASVEAERQRKQEAGRIGGMRKAERAAAAKAPAVAPALAPASPVLPEAALLPIPIPEIPPVVPPSGGPPGQGSLLVVDPPAGKGRRTGIPAGWRPRPDEFSTGAKLGFDAARVQFEADKFRDRALAEDTRHVRWDAAFANWLRNAARFDERDRVARPAPNPANVPPTPTGVFRDLPTPEPFRPRQGPVVAARTKSENGAVDVE